MEDTEKTASAPGIEWRSVASLFNLYEVSSRGDLKGLPRVTSDGKNLKERILTGRVDADGYMRYGIGINGVRYTLFAHRLVCEAFNGPAPDGKPNALHRDGDPSNNAPGNLYWGDQSDNNKDCVQHGSHYNASKTHCANGHEYSPDNVYLNDKGWRECKTCVTARHEATRSTPEYKEWRREYDRIRRSS